MGEKLVYNFVGEYSAMVADVGPIKVSQQTPQPHVSIRIPWGPATITCFLAMIPRMGDVLGLGAKRLREKIDIDVTQSRKVRALVSGQGSITGAPSLSGATLDERKM